MKKTFVLILCLITNYALASIPVNFESMFGEANKKSRKIREYKSGLPEGEKTPAQLIQIATDYMKLSNEELKDDVTFKKKFDSFLFSLRALCHYFQKEYPEAFSDCDCALLSDENNAHAYYVKGLIYFAWRNDRIGITCMKIASSKGYAPAHEIAMAF